MRTRNQSYMLTVKTDDPELPEILARMKREVKIWNAKRRVMDLENPKIVNYSWSGPQQVVKRAVVRVRGRLGKNNPNAHLYRRGGMYHRYVSQDIRLEHAAHVDIYISERIDYKPVSV